VILLRDYGDVVYLQSPRLRYTVCSLCNRASDKMKVVGNNPFINWTNGAGKIEIPV